MLFMMVYGFEMVYKLEVAQGFNKSNNLNNIKQLQTNKRRRQETGVSPQTAKPLERASAHRNQKLRNPET